MSTYRDIEILSRQVADLTNKVGELDRQAKDKPNEKTPEQKKAEIAANQKAEEEKVRKQAHDERVAKYKKDNHIDPPRKRAYINPERRDNPVVPAARNNKLDTPKPAPREQHWVPQPVQPIVYQSYFHEWKVTQANDVSGQPVLNTVAVAGGTVRTNGGSVVVDTDPALALSGTNEVFLKITRDSASRAITAAVIQQDTTVPTSTETDQYVPLAKVTLSDTGIATNILQRQFGEISVWEDLALENGEFVLVPLAISGRNTYAVPTP